jgi:hypothetical protein
MSTVPVRIVGRRLPGLTWSGRSGIHIGVVQRGGEVVKVVPGDMGEAIFDLEVEVEVDEAGAPDVKGVFVHGRRAERFLYLTWGEVDAEGAFAAFRRLRLHLSPLAEELQKKGLRAERRAEAFLELTDTKGRPIAASVRPPWVYWRVH